MESEEFRSLLRVLAGAEERHKSGLAALYQDFGGTSEDLRSVPDRCGTMEGGIAVEEGLQWAGGKAPDDVIEFLMGLETNALDLYLKVIGRVDDPKAKKVFAHLADEEREHLRRLEELVGR